MANQGKAESVPGWVRREIKERFFKLKNQLIQDVPEDIALCEFDCRKTQCRFDEWETCERRLRSQKSLRRHRAPK